MALARHRWVLLIPHVGIGYQVCLALPIVVVVVVVVVDTLVVELLGAWKLHNIIVHKTAYLALLIC